MKAQMGTLRDLIPTDLPSLGSPWRLSGAASLHGRSRMTHRLRVADVVISSVPGPLYLAGTAAIAPEAKAIAIAAASTGAKRRVRRAKPIEAATNVAAEADTAAAAPRRARARRRAGARARAPGALRASNARFHLDRTPTMTNDPALADADAVSAPGLLKHALDGRAPFELAAAFAALPLLAAAPRGDGHPVPVFPGLAASDFSTRPLRRWLYADPGRLASAAGR